MASIKNGDQTKRKQMSPHHTTPTTKVISKEVVLIFL